jgi:hypothetical protein
MYIPVCCWRFAVTGGCQSLIAGSYEYYHYLQDRFDDNVSMFFSSFGSCSMLTANRVGEHWPFCCLQKRIELVDQPFIISSENSSSSCVCTGNWDLYWFQITCFLNSTVQ